MDFQYLNTFCTVVSEGNMTVAASRLKITQPAVSQQIRYLEKDLGVKLLNRDARKVKPTIQGQIFYESSQRILSLLNNVKSSIKALSLNLSGENIRVCTLSSIGMHLVSPIIGNFLKLNQSMKLSLMYGTGEDVIQKMQSEDMDMVIMPDIRKEYGRDFPQFKKIPLFKDSLPFVGSGKDQNLPKSLNFKDLNRFRLVHIENHYLAFQNLFYQKMKELRLPFEISFRSDNIGTVKRVVESGLGCGFLPIHSIRKQLRLGRLKRIEVEDFSYSVNLNIYSKPDPKKDKILEILALLIQQQVQGLT